VEAQLTQQQLVQVVLVDLGLEVQLILDQMEQILH
jgi:hypothetical protein